MIYIDPPYNTGKEFIYDDDFSEDTASYFQRSNQKDEAGQRMVANTETNGRFHSDWLSMMYPRLKLARNLLRDDGVIFISIDDNEQANLKRLCDEIFGEENVLGTVIWKNVTDNNPSNIATEHENILVYARSKYDLESVWKSKRSDVKDVLVELGNKLTKQYENQDELQTEYSKWFRENKSQLDSLDRYKYIDKDGIYTGSQSVHNPGKEGYRYAVLHPITKLPCKEPLMGYRFPETTMQKLIEEGKILFGDNHEKIIELKVYAKDYVEKLSSVIELDGRVGAYDLKELFPELKKAFTNPKPVRLLSQYLSFVTGINDLVLDFFSGSATTAHAVMQLNAEDASTGSAQAGKRRFIMVQLPETCDEKSEAYKAGYQTIAEIGKERIRRAGQKILKGMSMGNQENVGEALASTSPLLQVEAKASPTETSPTKANIPDIGFRVLKIDSSNMKDVYYTPDSVRQDDLERFTDNIKDDRSPEDLLFQVLLDWGVDLTLPITQETIAGKPVLFVDGNALAACFEADINETFVKELSQRHPLRMV